MSSYIVTAEKMVFGASCITSIGGKTVFIPYSLPNETLKIFITKEHKNYSEAKIEKILNPSVHRVKPECPYFYDCGGCNMQIANDAYQKELRYEAALEALDRALNRGGGERLNIRSDFISGKSWEYRARFQFHITENGPAQKKYNSSSFVRIKDCPVALPAIRDFLRREVKNSEFFHGTVFKPGERIHLFSSDGKIFTGNGSEDCSVKLCGKILKFNPLGFFQSNLEMTEKLIDTVLVEVLGNVKTLDRILDFYAGVGTFSICAGDAAKEIHLVEHNKHALNYAKENFNLKTLGENRRTKIFYHAIDGAAWAKTKASRLFFNLAFIDPPRSGIDSASLNWFCRSNIPLICYISCDPVTFARDAVKLIGSGYKLKKHFIFDFYPQTHHVETLGIFEKYKS
ncbi:class I SAM-dependent RNA methyltransferase [Treponema pedis]|uniref:class I SAM-dependent RNA methyltransferase n=1 Tax=Treponema pedis TaxID=409322 RepID=UPI00041A49B5|nr:RsmD family RNA methyltransferase [Treponema pedis]